jgi:hypothetical protein
MSLPVMTAARKAGMSQNGIREYPDARLADFFGLVRCRAVALNRFPLDRRRTWMILVD